MYRVGRVQDHVQRSYKEHNRWMYVPEVRRAFTFKDLVDLLIIVLGFGAFTFAVCVVMAMCAQM